MLSATALMASAGKALRHGSKISGLGALAATVVVSVLVGAVARVSALACVPVSLGGLAAVVAGAGLSFTFGTIHGGGRCRSIEILPRCLGAAVVQDFGDFAHDAG